MDSQKSKYEILDSPTKRSILSTAIGDKPETVIWTHVLRLGNCNAYSTGEANQCKAAVVQAHEALTEPSGFGHDVISLWNLLKLVDGWNCVLVDRDCAIPLSRIIQKNTGARIRFLDDINYSLLKPVSHYPNKKVRRLTIEDSALLETVPSELQGGLWGSTHTLLTHGVVAAAVTDGQVIATAVISAISEHYADIGIYTLPEFRGRGFATSCASVIARHIQTIGKTPVWSTGEHNYPSKRIADKLGFAEVLRRTYIVLENAPNFVNARELQDN